MNQDLLELEDDFYYPIETIFIGKNSSGKTSTLLLIDLVFTFLRSGRINKNNFYDKDVFDLEIVFYENETIYKYNGSFKKDETRQNEYFIIKEESLERTKLKASYKKDLSNAGFSKDNNFVPNIDGDTSNISKLIPPTGFNLSVANFENSVELFNIFYSVLGNKTFSALLHLFDDGIDYIKPHLNANKNIDGFSFKRVNDPTAVVYSSVIPLLSAGTIRGINLYGMSILAFKAGGTIIVDEIEKSFNKNLIENLLFMFNDSSINKMGASIIYSTHYSELLDTNNRCDNINVLHRVGNEISLLNMSSDYDCRTDMLKSNQFNQNVFDTLLNYDRLMDLKETLR